MVRLGANGSLESHFLANPKESETKITPFGRSSLVRVGKPLVEIPNRNFIQGKGKDIGLEGIVANFVGASFAKIMPFRGDTNKENISRLANCDKLDGVFGSNKDDSSLCHKPTDFSANHFQGATNKNNGARDMHIKE